MTNSGSHGQRRSDRGHLTCRRTHGQLQNELTVATTDD